MSNREMMALLGGVSRSFVLTIRALPRGLRMPIGTAYLLARASDTIADTAIVPANVRLELLREFSRQISREGEGDLPERLAREISPANEAEKQLLRNLGRVFAALRSFPETDRKEIAGLLEKIMHGQALDLNRFPEPGRIHALSNAGELEEYTYLVAGCVGEFWTRVCQMHLSRYSMLDQEELCRLGRHFGQGLQLVNILRDMPEDLRNGRCYLPADELRAAGVNDLEALQADAAKATPVFESWRRKALAWHGEARLYIEAIRPWRVRFACLLPWAIGVRTLQLMRDRPPLLQAARVKVSRAEVGRIMRRAALAAFSNGEVRKWARDLTVAQWE